MYRILLLAAEVPWPLAPLLPSIGTASNVQCSWDGHTLLLQADNDFDRDGTTLSDEFSDAIVACIAEGLGGSITVESFTAFAGI